MLARDKFAEVNTSQINSLLAILSRKCVSVEIDQPLDVIAEDPDDGLVLTTAHKGKARYIVTGDKHLLKMREFKGIEVVTTRRMLELVKSSKD